MSYPAKEKASAYINTQATEEGILNILIGGTLDSYTTGEIWKKAVQIIAQTSPKEIVVDASEINYCDGAGIALFVKLRQLQEGAGRRLEVRNLANDFQQLLDLFPSGEIAKTESQQPGPHSLPEKIGRATVNVLDEIRASITFIGEAGIALFYALRNPQAIRWQDVFLTSEKIGVNAFSIIALVNFLVGLVIAFQSAIPLKKYGGELFVADLLVLSVFRELGPLMTAIVVNGRSGSAFAAEIGTMKVNEEVDALTTMGLDPVRFLVVPKVIASLLMIPILTAFGNFFGLLGGGVVMLALGFPPVAYINEMVYAASYVDFLGGLFKSLFFATIIAGVGCLEGLRTKTGAAAVGDSTTSAVVSGIVLIIFVDGIFGVVFYYLGI